jgi:uncharacterized protein with von Willebrand factor type A (vWA) domain
MQFLRGKKIPVSPADTLDAIEAAELLGYTGQNAAEERFGGNTR